MYGDAVGSRWDGMGKEGRGGSREYENCVLL